MVFLGVGRRQKKALRLSVRQGNQRGEKKKKEEVNMDYRRAAAGAGIYKKNLNRYENQRDFKVTLNERRRICSY